MNIKRLMKLQIRKRKRRSARDGAYVIYGHSVSKRQINDISMGGLSFYYVDKGRRIHRGFRELSIVNGNRVCLKDLPFRTVSDVETGEVMFQKKRVKRQSVRFGRLSHRQKRQLRALIANLSQ